MDNDKRKLIHFNSSIFDIKNDDIYYILSKNQGYPSVMHNHVVSVLNLLDNSRTSCSKKKFFLYELLSKAAGIEMQTIKIIMDLVTNLGFIEALDGVYSLTAYGKLFLMSDSISQQADIIRYFWEKADWSKIVPEMIHDKFAYIDARRYIACMLSRITDDKFKHFDVYNKSGREKGSASYIVFCADYFAYRELLASKTLKYILSNIFEPLGIVKFANTLNPYEFSLSQKGKLLFEHYSQGMIDEYKMMIDECWDSYDRGNFQEALDNALSIIKIVGIIPEALNVIGCVYIKKNEYASAEEIFNFALEMCSSNPLETNIQNGFYAETYISIYYNLGLCCVSMGENFKALHIFNTIKKTVSYNIESIDEITREIKKSILI